MLKIAKISPVLLSLSFILNILFFSKLYVRQDQYFTNIPSGVKQGNIFNFGRIHNHVWTPLNSRLAKDINLIDHMGEWARNKTILLLGDSVDRKTVQWLCTYKAWNLSQGSYPSAEGWTDCEEYNGCPNVCTSTELNITIMNAFMVGLNPDESLRARTGHHFPNNQTMDPKRRLVEIYLPFMRNILKRDPDVVVFNSGLWDLMHWTRKFVSKNVSAIDFDVVTDQRLAQYVNKLDNFALYLKNIFKNSLLMWRDMPSSPLGVDQVWGLMDLPNYIPNGEARMFRNTYLDSLNIAAEVMLEQKHSDIIILPWNKVTRGEMYFEDDIHPDGPVYKAVVNMWLYFFKKVI